LRDVEASAVLIRTIAGPGTTVIPLQKGMDAPDRVAPVPDELTPADKNFHAVTYRNYCSWTGGRLW
jgi:hypothetical protein